MSGRGTPATDALERAGIAFTLHEYEGASGAAGGRVVRENRERRHAYGLEAAAALGVGPARMFKTLIADADGRLVAAIVPVAGELDLRSLAAALGARRAAMAEPKEAERATGYVVGGISPFGQRRPLPVVVDISVLEHSTVFVSAGRRGLQIEMVPVDLIAAAGARTAAIGRSS